MSRTGHAPGEPFHASARRQAERPADGRQGASGGGRSRDRLITLLPGSGGVVNAQRAPVSFGQAAPDAVGDPVAERVVQARLPDRAPGADLPGRLGTAGEKHGQVGAAARSPVPPPGQGQGRGWQCRGAVTRLVGGHFPGAVTRARH